MRTCRPLARAVAFAPVVLAVCAVAACASRPTAGTEAIRDPAAGSVAVTRVEGTAGTLELRSVNSTAAGVETPVRADADQAFAVLQGVYDAIGLKINTLVTDSRTAGVRNGRAPRRLGGLALSRLLECGTDITGIANADSYSVTLTTLSRVTSAGPASSLVVTQVVASAKPKSTSGNEVRCSSNGRLAQAINDAVAERAVK
jgi:hypothetical protein